MSLRATACILSACAVGVWAQDLFMPPQPDGGSIHITPGCLAKDDRHSELWCPGDAGYECYKIPTLLRIPNTTELLGFIEARKYSCDDNGYVDLLLRRSHDNGKTWTDPQMVYGNSTEKEWHTIGDALPVYDAFNGKVHLVFTRDNREAWLTHSSDGGETWEAPRNISDVAVRGQGNDFVGTGHDGGLQLKSGRLLVPMYGGGGDTSFVLASDDHGATWRILGDVQNKPNEWAMAFVEEEGGNKLVGSLRVHGQGFINSYVVRHFRAMTWSDDGGETWSQPTTFKDIPEPVSGCEGAMFRHPNGKLYFSHPDDDHAWHWPLPRLRNIMRIKVSEDGGHSWRNHKTIWGPDAGCDDPCVPAASYSSMVALSDDVDSPIGLVYMRNNVTMIVFEGRGVSFTTFEP